MNCKQLNVTAQNKKCAEKSGDVSMMQLTTHFIISYFYETSILQISKIDEKKNSTMCSHLNNHLFTNQMMNSEHLDVFISTIRIFRSIRFCPVTQLHFWPLSVHFFNHLSSYV